MKDKDIVLTLRQLHQEIQDHKKELMKVQRPLDTHELRSLEHLAKADRYLQDTKHEIFAAFASNHSQQAKVRQNRQAA